MLLIVFEFLFILLLAIVLAMIFKNEGFSLKNRPRQAKLEEYWDGKNRRQHPRFTKSLEVVYSIMKRRPSKTAAGKTVDISEGGAKLVLDEKLLPGTAINLKILLPGSSQAIETAGEVVWTEDASNIKEPSGKRFFYSGIKFSTVKEPSGNHLLDFIRSLVPSLET